SCQNEQSSAATGRNRRDRVEDFSRPQKRKSSTRFNHARRLPFVTGRAARDLVCVESPKFWRPDRDQIENRIVRLDPKAVWRMVDASHLHTARNHRILGGSDREFLARRICLAPATNGFRRGGRVLCGFIRNCNSRDRFLGSTPIARQRTTI